MSTSIDKMTEVLIEKVLSKSDIDKLVKELKPAVLKELRDKVTKEISKYNFSNAISDALSENAYYMAQQLIKTTEIVPKKKVKK